MFLTEIYDLDFWLISETIQYPRSIVRIPNECHKYTRWYVGQPLEETEFFEIANPYPNFALTNFVC